MEGERDEDMIVFMASFSVRTTTGRFDILPEWPMHFSAACRARCCLSEEELTAQFDLDLRLPRDDGSVAKGCEYRVTREEFSKKLSNWPTAAGRSWNDILRVGYCDGMRQPCHSCH